jgi:flagellar biosynthesis GTPase FlhF
MAENISNKLAPQKAKLVPKSLAFLMKIGIIDDALLPNITDRRETKIVVYGKAGVGKTSIIANLCGYGTCPRYL